MGGMNMLVHDRGQVHGRKEPMAPGGLTSLFQGEALWSLVLFCSFTLETQGSSCPMDMGKAYLSGQRKGIFY